LPGQRDDVVSVVAESDLCAALFDGDRVKYPAAEPRTKRAERFALGDVGFDDRVSVFLNYPVIDAKLFKIIWQHLGRKAGLLLVEINGEDVKIYRCPAANVEQQVEHRVAVLSARKADHHPVALGDHSKIADRLAHLL